MRKRMKFGWRSSLNDCFEAKRRTAESVFGAAFFSTLGVGAFTFALSVNAASVGLSPAWLGLAFSGYFLARLVLAPVSGYAADCIGAVPLLLVATALGTIVPGLYLVFPRIEILGVVQICLGFCSGIIKPVSMSLLGDCAPQNKSGSLFGAYSSCLYAAFVLGPLAGGCLTYIQDGIGPLTLAMPSLGMGLTFMFFFQAYSESSPYFSKKKEVKKGVPWRNSTFLALLLAVFGRTLGSSVVITFLPRLLNERYGLSGILAGLLFALPNLVIVGGLPATSPLADNRDKTGLTFLGMGVCAACIFGFGQPVSQVFLAFLAIAMGFGSALSMPASMALVSELGAARGRVMGVFIGASNIGFVLGPSLAGFAAGHGGITAAFELTALVGGLCLLPMFVIMSR